MPEKSIEEILADLLNTSLDGNFVPNEYGREKIHIAAKSIKDYYLAKLPEKKTGMDDQQDNFLYGHNIAVFIEGYNQAIAEMRRAIEEG